MRHRTKKEDDLIWKAILVAKTSKLGTSRLLCRLRKSRGLGRPSEDPAVSQYAGFSDDDSLKIPRSEEITGFLWYWCYSGLQKSYDGHGISRWKDDRTPNFLFANVQEWSGKIPHLHQLRVELILYRLFVNGLYMLTSCFVTQVASTRIAYVRYVQHPPWRENYLSEFRRRTRTR
jgi:hypothetical protein